MTGTRKSFMPSQRYDKLDKLDKQNKHKTDHVKLHPLEKQKTRSKKSTSIQTLFIYLIVIFTLNVIIVHNMFVVKEHTQSSSFIDSEFFRSWRRGTDNSTNYIFQPDGYSERLKIRGILNDNIKSVIKVKRKKKVIVDVISIGTKRSPEKSKGQKDTWGSHESIRSFWSLTEKDDVHSLDLCTSQFNMTKIKNYIYKCKTMQKGDSRLMMSYRSRHFGIPGLYSKKKPLGWLCAQRRPGFGLGKKGIQYRAQTVRYGIQEAIPDYLFLIDDDTYINMELFSKHMQNIDPSEPLVYAGCLTLNPSVIKSGVKWAYPLGGFGLILSRGSIERMIHPIYCLSQNSSSTSTNINNTKFHRFESLVCERLKDNLLNEQKLFRPGMSISDLAFELALREDYCMHSDWLSGFLVNYYYLSDPVPNTIYRVHPYLGILNNKTCENNAVGKCDTLSHICHKQDKTSMLNITLQVMASNRAVFTSPLLNSLFSKIETLKPFREIKI